MKSAGMFLVESASFQNETLQVKGGLFDGLKASKFPASHDVTVVVLLRAERSDVGVSRHLDVNVVGPDGARVGQNHYDVTLNVFRRQIAAIVQVRATFAEPGEYRVRLEAGVGDDEVAFDVAGPESDPVASAVEGYALGLGDKA